MDKNRYHRNELLAQTVIKGLESRNMTGYYAADKNEALQKALELIPEGSSIAMGGCVSAQEIGLVDALKEIITSWTATGWSREKLFLQPMMQIYFFPASMR